MTVIPEKLVGQVGKKVDTGNYNLKVTVSSVP